MREHPEFTPHKDMPDFSGTSSPITGKDGPPQSSGTWAHDTKEALKRKPDVIHLQDNKNPEGTFWIADIQKDGKHLGHLACNADGHWRATTHFEWIVSHFMRKRPHYERNHPIADIVDTLKAATENGRGIAVSFDEDSQSLTISKDGVIQKVVAAKECWFP